MTSATNKDFSSSEINNIVLNESDRIWSFIWQGPAYMEFVIVLVTSSIIVFQTIGWCGLLALIVNASRVLVQYAKGKTEADIEKELRGKREMRNLYINESFNNIKTLKLFGWESNYLDMVDGVFKEELEIESK